MAVRTFPAYLWLPVPTHDAVYLPISFTIPGPGKYKAKIRCFSIDYTDRVADPGKVVLTPALRDSEAGPTIESRYVAFENIDEVVTDLYIAGTLGSISPFMMTLVKWKHSNAYRANIFKDASAHVKPDLDERLSDLMQVFHDFPNMTVNDFKAQVSIYKMERVPETNSIDLTSNGLVLNNRFYLESLCISKEILPSD